MAYIEPMLTPTAAAWHAALSAAEAAPDIGSDALWCRAMAIENKIASTPVRSTADAALQLQIAVTMATRQGVADDPAWMLVGNVLAFLSDAT